MRGVKYVDYNRGVVAVLADEGQYSIFELMGGDCVELEDVVSWENGTALGGEKLVNHTQRECYDVYLQNHYVPFSQLRQQLVM